MKDFNLSEWVLTHRAFTGFLMVLVLLGGMFASVRLGQREDPEFTFRVMVVKTLYPGATALEVEQQVTDRLEKKIQELPNLDFLRSYSKPGESVIFVTPREDTPPKDIPELWYQVRKKVGDIRMALPPGIVGPFFNDEFGDTYSLLYAFSGEGYSYAELKQTVDSTRTLLDGARIPGEIVMDHMAAESLQVNALSHHFPADKDVREKGRIKCTHESSTGIALRRPHGDLNVGQGNRRIRIVCLCVLHTNSAGLRAPGRFQIIRPLLCGTFDKKTDEPVELLSPRCSRPVGLF